MTSVRDIIFISILLFVAGISIVLVVDSSHRINAQLLLTPTFLNDSNAVSVIEHTDAAINMTDYIYLALFVAFFIAIMISGWLVGSEPIVAPIYFFVVVIFTFIAIILQNVWGDIASSPYIVSTLSSLPITAYILSHLGYFMAAFGLLGILAMFAKPTQPQTY